ncbi:tryptophan 2,3-dioxygenase [Thecamonas trahens ATCC 50062]|uniref:Tryptophan 2,3-dioxygenase n=1 Tax=Thecamonas trahens ATCC 50062 TaxID=461836 RepID=A0A0L0DCS5_THETB|nr:tryptophan 2,3-dioxygenase [Thecamonas trahens ATCC 50062]KNC50040.1 tryptophan 2,3-dioxygenase [Thecamonas trahens ATCC 50062]|eukprot:XP_013757206.1 tryptophan 2,3-dioxygenase [Thecamonas trahens ATCC 50062]
MSSEPARDSAAASADTSKCPVPHGAQGMLDETSKAVLTKLAQSRSENITSLGAETIHPFLAAPSQRDYTEACTYWDYIHPETLTSLQSGREGKGLNHHDEHLFIIVHQVFELWFKQVLHDLDYTIETLLSPDARRDEWHLATSRLRRAHEILRISMPTFEALAKHHDPQDFLEYRWALSPASGFQSAQFRILELRFGITEKQRKCEFVGDYRDAFITKLADKTQVFDEAETQPTLKEAVMSWLDRIELDHLDTFFTAFLDAKSAEHNHQISELRAALDELDAVAPSIDVDAKLLKQMLHKEKRNLAARIEASTEQWHALERFYADPRLGRARKAATFLLTFRHYSNFIDLADTVQHALDFEAAFVLWRTHHARMVERMIGRRHGTGGSSGMDYLDDTTRYRVFKDLAFVRSIALPASMFPSVVSLFD